MPNSTLSLSPAVEQSRLFEGFTPEEILELLGDLGCHVIGFRKGECISAVIRSYHAQPLVYLLSGRAMFTKCDPHGNQSILDFISPGCLLGCFGIPAGSGIPGIDLVATSPSQALCLNTERLWAPDSTVPLPLLARLNRNIVELLAQCNQRLLEKSDIISRHSLREKVLSFLSAQRRIYRSDTFELPMNWQEIADFLYTNRSALSRQLGQLRAEGVIDFHKNRFTLLFPAE